MRIYDDVLDRTLLRRAHKRLQEDIARVYRRDDDRGGDAVLHGPGFEDLRLVDEVLVLLYPLGDDGVYRRMLLCSRLAVLAPGLTRFLSREDDRHRILGARLGFRCGSLALRLFRRKS